MVNSGKWLWEDFLWGFNSCNIVEGLDIVVVVGMERRERIENEVIGFFNLLDNGDKNWEELKMMLGFWVLEKRNICLFVYIFCWGKWKWV